ncbi:DMT family transporter [Sorangium sp. So ce341]|uniref:DMT family transporter n=1 Tax=Sorangium sp. So ce341 TaxID=3133302 RepID=UPI003F627C2B
MPTSDPSKPPGERRASAGIHAALFFATFAFASLSVEGKLAMSPPHDVSPAALAMARFLGGAVVFAGAHLALRTPRVARPADALHLAVLAFFGVVCNQALFLVGLRITSAVSATLLIAMIPVFTAAIAALTGREPLSRRAGAGTAVALFGAAMLTGFAVPRLGDSFALAYALSTAVYVIYAKSALQRLGTVTVMAWVFGWGTLMFAPIGGAALVREAPSWSLPAALLVAFCVLVPTVMAYAVNAWALRRASPTLVAIYVFLRPPLAALLAWIQLGEAVSARTAAAGFVLLAGVTIVATAPSPPAGAAAQPAPPPPDGDALARSTGLPLLAANGGAPSRPPARSGSIKA